MNVGLLLEVYLTVEVEVIINDHEGVVATDRPHSFLPTEIDKFSTNTFFLPLNFAQGFGVLWQTYANTCLRRKHFVPLPSQTIAGPSTECTSLP